MTFQSLLSNRDFDIEFHGYLTNHAKHAIVALERLDAPPQRLQEYWDEYTQATPYNFCLHPVSTPWSDVTPISSANEWKDLRGQKLKWQEMCIYLQQQLDSTTKGNVNELVQAYATPELLSGMAGALTHGIIHLGWAIDAGNPWMTIEGLAYLNFCHVGIDMDRLVKSVYTGDATPIDSWVRIARQWEQENLQETWIAATKRQFDESFHPELVPAGFQWELAKVLSNPHAVALHLPAWLEDDEIPKLWEELYKAVTLLYLTSVDSNGNGNFLVLHLLTSLWGLEQTLKVIHDDETTRQALRCFYAVAVCLLATSAGGFPSKESLIKVQGEYPDDDKVDEVLEDDETVLWTPLVQRAIPEREEHNIKLVYVARELWRRYGRWTGFRVAAGAFTLTPNIGPSDAAFKA